MSRRSNYDNFINTQFLNFFLDDLEIARNVHQAFKTNGIDVCFHYYDNNWHYIRKWEHLTTQKSLFPLSQEVKDGLAYLTNKTLSPSCFQEL